MEYTKDMIFKVSYGNEGKTGKEKWTSRVLQAIREHKIMTATVFSAFVFISIDMVLISNFFRILTKC